MEVMQGEEIFLVDANGFITPYRQYYPFDFAPGFWEQIKPYIENGSIAILDMVKDEILKGRDELQEWMSDINIETYIDHRQREILIKYGEILDDIEQDPCYKDSARNEWAMATVADAWLIATAAVKGYTIITLEQRQNPSPGSPCKEARIPDIADRFDVRTENLFYMMRKLGIRL